MTFLEQSEGSRVVFSMPPILSHPNMQFNLEENNSEANLPFLDLNINVSQVMGVTCSWYQKPTDTGTTLSNRSCAPTQYKRSVIQGTVHRVFRSTSSWEQFDKAMETKRAQWLTNGALKFSLQRWRQTPCAKSSRVRASPWIVRGICQRNHQRM